MKNSTLTCLQFHQFLLNHPKLLNLKSASEKYEKILENVEEGLSNSWIMKKADVVGTFPNSC